MHGSYTRFTTILDTNHVSPRLRGAAGDTRRCRGEQHARKRTVEFETMLDLRDVSGSAARSRLPVGAFDDAHLVTRSSCRSVCSCSSTRGTRRPHGHALRCTSELLRRERSIGSTRDFFSGEGNRRLSTRQPMDGSDGSTRVARLVLRLLVGPFKPTLYLLVRCRRGNVSAQPYTLHHHQLTDAVGAGWVWVGGSAMALANGTAVALSPLPLSSRSRVT